tara:strand:+ start:26889 stop:27071 length:183 start_codon:yes stop_codon:yes gene_type:complete
LQRNIIIACVEITLNPSNCGFVTGAANDAILAWCGISNFLKLFCLGVEVVNVKRIDEGLL